MTTERDRPDKEKAPPHIEVTPEMIRAAYKVLRYWDATAEELPSKEAIRDMFLAMDRLRTPR